MENSDAIFISDVNNELKEICRNLMFSNYNP